MGLDMDAYTTSEDIPALDFAQPKTLEKLFYWRKHPDLHGWMEDLYRSKGGRDPDFNLEPVRLDLADIDALEAAVKSNNLPQTSGFFFGESAPEDKERDLEFIQQARAALGHGKKVFYVGWW